MKKLNFGKNIPKWKKAIKNRKYFTNFSKIEKYYLPSYEIDPMKLGELFTQIFGCIEDIIQNIQPKVNISRLKNFLNLSLDFFVIR